MPSAPYSSACAASSGNSALPRRETRTPSRVTQGSTRASARGRTRRSPWPARSAASSGSPGSMTTAPCDPSTASVAPAGMRVVASCRPTTAGIPKDRARIEVWWLGDPASVAMASTCSQSSSAASEGVRSTATITKFPGRRASEGASVAPPRLSWMRPSTSSRSVVRSLRYSSLSPSKRSCRWSDTVRSAHSAFTSSSRMMRTAESSSSGSSSIRRWASKM